jgi:hypothetical protein
MIVLFIIAARLYLIHRLENGPIVKYSLWLLTMSAILFFSAVIAGNTTHSNIFHLFNWLYLPEHMILGLALLSPMMMLVVLFSLRVPWLKAAYSNSELESAAGRKRVLIFSVSLPLLFLAVLTYVLAGGYPNKYAALESGMLIIAALGTALFPPARMYRLVKDAFYANLWKPVFIAGSLLFLTALIRWIL